MNSTTIQDLTLNAEEIKRSELENLREHTEEEIGKLHREQVEEIRLHQPLRESLGMAQVQNQQRRVNLII